ncbi:DUF1266 domain-containing protein [Flavobacterium limi]|uniref:DUF1266 domain-containing protein n=1 Tax=Flavobacterium limi TaxID=2045105 RepID=A0ABQ1UKN6_9FLAO|nr:DUF1266 domain-containing protein [Flavobacterium limi]GGF21408.1 hypothetical protein GCM10011518_33230 [Flavobacterium limi]
MSTITTYYKFENPTNLSKSQLWLIATSAMLTQLNKEFHDTLLPHHIYGTEALLEDSKQCLLRDWDTKNIADLSDTIKYLHTKKTFEPVQNSWEFLSESEFDKTKYFGNNMMELRNLTDMTRNYQYDLNNSDFAWHYGRCAWVIRHAFYNGFITEEETWNLLKENGNLIKKSFDSWESFGLSYLVGAQFWKRDNYNEVTMRETKNNITFLLSNKNSPWLNVSWNDYE